MIEKSDKVKRLKTAHILLWRRYCPDNKRDINVLTIVYQRNPEIESFFITLEDMQKKSSVVSIHDYINNMFGICSIIVRNDVDLLKNMLEAILSQESIQAIYVNNDFFWESKLLRTAFSPLGA